MSKPKWTPTKIEWPEDKRSCIVITESGDERELFFERRLWWLPSREMYVYFIPPFWRYKEEV